MSRTNNDLIAVVDVETTGLSPWRHDRVIEVAVVLISTDGLVHHEYETLVNPERDLGPTRLHQISAAEVLAAPRFSDIAGDLASLLSHASVLAGHNISYDRAFLAKEYERIGFDLPEISLLCTYRLLGRTDLTACCREFDLPFAGEPHRAICDARATAQLVQILFRDYPHLVEGVVGRRESWPSIPPLNTQPVTRDDALAALSGPPRFLQRILARVQRDTEATGPDVMAYLGLIDRVLEDRVIDVDEEEVLADAVSEWGLNADQVAEAHASYLQALALHALADGIVSSSERVDLHNVAKLLGLDDSDVDEVLDAAVKQIKATSPGRGRGSARHELIGKRVCFTGELRSSIDGQAITREMAQLLAEQNGLVVANSVTKKLDVLVVADPHSQSGKAKKARQYGTRILADAVFWGMIGVPVD